MISKKEDFAIPEKSIISLAFIYLMLPNMLFLLGWVREYIALPLCILLFAVGWNILKYNVSPDVKRCSRRDIFYLILSLLLALLLTDIIGFHGHVLQGGDFRVRNPIYQMLIEQEWPIFSARGEYFVYYHIFWLVPAYLCKIFGAWVSPATLLFGWMYLGISIALALLFIRIRRHILIFLLVLFSFGKVAMLIDFVLPALFRDADWLGTAVELLGGKGEFSYVIFYVQWVEYFNHILPCLICVSLYLTKALPLKYYAVPAALMVMSSPMCAIAVFIILLFLYLRNPKAMLLASLSWQVWLCVLFLCCGIIYILGQHGTEGATEMRWLWSETQYSNMWCSLYADVRLRLLRYAVVVTSLLFPLYVLLQKPLRRTMWWKAIILFAVLFPIVWIGRHDNQLQKKGCMVMYVLCAWLMTYQWKHAKIGRKCAIVVFLLCSTSHIAGDILHRDFLHYTWSREGVARHIYDPWGGTLNHPEKYEYGNFWGEVKVPQILYSEPGESVTVLHPLRCK